MDLPESPAPGDSGPVGRQEEPQTGHQKPGSSPVPALTPQELRDLGCPKVWSHDYLREIPPNLLPRGPWAPPSTL